MIVASVFPLVSLSSVSINLLYILCKSVLAILFVSCVIVNPRPDTGNAYWDHVVWYPIPNLELSEALIRTVYSVAPLGKSIFLLVKLPVLFTWPFLYVANCWLRALAVGSGDLLTSNLTLSFASTGATFLVPLFVESVGRKLSV